MGGGVVPLAIGTRGTVGSLVKKEIEYFTKLELERRGDGGSKRIGGEASKKTSFWVLSLTWKWKKRRTNNGILPNSLCSDDVQLISKANRFNGISGFPYRILKDDLNYFPI